MAVQSDVAIDDAGPYDRAKALSAFKLGDVTFYWITRLSAISVLLILGGIILSLIVGAWPAMKEYGFAFLWTQRWAPSADPPVLGALGPMYGTLVTSFIAMLIAIPVGLGIAIFLTELCPQWLRRPIGMAIELLAGIPSIIYGMWGFFVLGPFLANTFQPFMIEMFDGVPVLGAIFAGPPSYLSLFNAALILADHGAALHHLDLGRRVQDGAAGAEGSRLRRRLHHLGSRPQRGDSLHPRRRHRRRHAGARPRARRDHGGDLHHRQLVPHLVSIFAPGTTISAAIAIRVRRERRPASVRPDPARPAAVRADVLRARRGAADADASGKKAGK